ncbi:DUF1648 domain-containing protein [Paraclostridium bifermentans]|uniref:DUF1648 domain-containing protein n=1 Tax=Paraclostridium bifermentans TaxID=1490 RepID=UPI001C81B7C1|nr:DUF1648 domain-containing protein [Paraclostridium bifermentans]GIM33340.1 hypothetical protein PAGU1678_26090 [Paraclostridium bifermentans subsp. muricolitidis]
MENLATFMMMIPIIVIVHLLMLYVQALSGKNYFYGVYVKNIELEENDKQRVDRSYKKKLNITLVLLVIISLLGHQLFNFNGDVTLTFILILYLILNFYYLRSSYIDVIHLKSKLLTTSSGHKDKDANAKTMSIDTKFISEKSKVKNKFKILFGICILISLITFAYVVFNYNSLPETIPTHWGIEGKPDTFAPKTFKNVFMLNILDIAMVLMFSYLTIETIGSRSYIDTENKEEIRKKALRYLSKMGYAFWILTLSIQLTIIPMQWSLVSGGNIPTLIFFISIFLPMISIIYLIYIMIMISTLKSKNKNSYVIESDDEKWIYGFIYYNKEDPSFMVEKRIGAGWTFNMANKKSQWLCVLLVLLIIVSIIGF